MPCRIGRDRQVGNLALDLISDDLVGDPLGNRLVNDAADAEHDKDAKDAKPDFYGAGHGLCAMTPINAVLGAPADDRVSLDAQIVIWPDSA